MEDRAFEQSVLAIAGMHRSGTSLATSLLQSSGVFIGDRLMEGGTGNTRGHFEDWDFVDLHREALTSLEINREGWTTQTDLRFTDEYLKRAKNLIAARQGYAVWGWKDPRTTLFLNCWSELVWEIKFIFIYRSPWDVVDSLFRRGDLIFKSDPQIAIATWLSYNQAILRFCQQTDKPWILLRIEDVIENPQFVIEAIEQQFGLHLRSPQQLYDRTLFQTTELNRQRATLIRQCYPQACELYLQLDRRATLISDSPGKIAEYSQAPWFWQNWLDRPAARIRATVAWSRLKRSATDNRQ